MSYPFLARKQFPDRRTAAICYFYGIIWFKRLKINRMRCLEMWQGIVYISGIPTVRCNFMIQSFIIVLGMLAVCSCSSTTSTETKPSVSTPVVENKTTVQLSKPSTSMTPVLFVQWQYPNTVEPVKVVDIRQNVEQKINDALKANGQGKWFAGDLGPGGANMLFDVVNEEQAFNIIIKVLTAEKLENQTVIAKRIYKAADNWNYEVVYPKDYKGEFNDM